MTVDVVVIGGGIVGITTALFLKESGLKVILIESDRIATKTTGHTTAKITSLHGLLYGYLISSFGVKNARIHAQASEEAIKRIESICQKYHISCDFIHTSAFTFAETTKEAEKVRKEVEAAKKLGLPASFTKDLPLPVKSYGAVKFDRQAQFHPRKYLLPLADKIPGNGSFIFENTRALNFQEGEPCIVETDRGKIRAKDVVIATHVPFFKKPGLFFSRLYQIHSYVLGVYIKGKVPEGMYYGTKTHTIRNQTSGKGTILLMGGIEHKVGEGGDIEKIYAGLVNYYSRLFPVEKISYHWSTQDPDTPDRIPFIGRVLPDSRHIFAASGFHGWGMTNGTVAAMIISDLILGKDNPWKEFYNPNRLNLKESASRFVSENVDAGRQFIKGKFAEKDKHEPRFCTFEGCKLSWNNAENTWDCPCCGSRFTGKGKVLYGPAVFDLPEKD